MAAIPPSVKITRLDYPSEVAVKVRRPIRVWIHNESRLFPIATEFRPLLYYWSPEARRWLITGYGDIASGRPYCFTMGWEFSAWSDRVETVRYKIEAVCRNAPAGLPDRITTDSRTFTIRYVEKAPPPRPWWWPPWLPWLG